MKKIALSLALCSVALFAGKNVVVADVPPVDVPAATQDVANSVSNGVALKLGTLGVGADFEHYFSDKFALRRNINYFKYTKDKTIKDVPFHGKLTLFTAGVLADYHPWASSFRVSGGLYYNRNKFDLTGKKSGSITINGRNYDLGQTTISGKIDFKKIAPYFGIGWSSVESNGWHFTADIGVMYHGKPKVKLTLQNPNYNSSQLEADRAAKENEIYNKIKKYKYYPVVSIGIEKKF